jgi:GWxTD domain-containing protein
MAEAVCYRSSLECEKIRLNRKLLSTFILAALLAGNALAAAEKLSPELQRWLEDVSPILTKAERAVFSKLQTNLDRAKFVRFFWRMRDPLPDTTANEFQREYEERIRYADQNFGHYSPKRGSQTDRGFFYVVLGKPLERTQYTTQSQIWPLELWFYKGEQEFGLPDYFYLIFYQPEGIGDFRLYSPSVEGPENSPSGLSGRGCMGGDRRRHQESAPGCPSFLGYYLGALFDDHLLRPHRCHDL